MSLFKGLTLRQEPHTLRLSRVLLSVFLGRILDRRAESQAHFSCSSGCTVDEQPLKHYEIVESTFLIETD